MTAEPAVERREAELPAVAPVRAQVEACGAQPRRHDVFAAMAGLEDPQRLRLEIATLVLGDGEVVVLDLPQALAAKARGADVVARRLRAVASDKRAIDGVIDGGADAGWAARSLVLAAGAMVQIEHAASQKGMSSLSAWRCIDSAKPVDTGLDDAVDLVRRCDHGRRHQAELGQHLGEIAPRVLDARVSMSVLSIMPLFLLAMAAPASRQRSEQNAKVGKRSGRS